MEINTPETVCPDCDNGRINVLPGCSVGGAWRECSTCNGTGRIPAQVKVCPGLGRTHADGRDWCSHCTAQGPETKTPPSRHEVLSGGETRHGDHGLYRDSALVGLDTSIPKSPAEAEQIGRPSNAIASESSIPPTPSSAGEGELEAELHLNRGYYHLFINNYHGPELCPECIRKGAGNAINAYIARRVLEVIGEDDPYAPGILGVRTRNQLRAEQRQRIAAIKKESQQ